VTLGGLAHSDLKNADELGLGLTCELHQQNVEIVAHNQGKGIHDQRGGQMKRGIL